MTDIHPHADRLQRSIHEWCEDAITAAMLARLPVDHVRTCTVQLREPRFRYEVVLSGGHVYARREWRMSLAEQH